VPRPDMAKMKRKRPTTPRTHASLPTSPHEGYLEWSGFPQWGQVASWRRVFHAEKRHFGEQ
jgi:hypothetical protein